MSGTEHNHKREDEPYRESVEHGHRPYWRRAHHDWRFWVGLVSMLTAITFFIMTNNLSMLPRFHSHSQSDGGAR
jgi:hypothetical protein